MDDLLQQLTSNPRPGGEDGKIVDWILETTRVRKGKTTSSELAEKRMREEITRKYGDGYWKVADLRNLFVRCDCAACKPSLYAEEPCTRHRSIDEAAPKQGLNISHKGKKPVFYPMYDLSKHAGQTIRRSKEDMTADQLDAINEFRRRWEEKGHKIFGYEFDLRKKLQLRDMLHIAELLNRILFSGLSPIRHTVPGTKGPRSLTFEWDIEKLRNQRLLGQAQYHSEVFHVIMYPLDRLESRDSQRYFFEHISISPPRPSSAIAIDVASDRLDTVVHELIHVFLACYGCRACSTANSDYSMISGHGRAWQILAKVAGEVLPELLGTKIHIGRHATVINNHRDGLVGPCLHDLIEWGIVTEKGP